MSRTVHRDPVLVRVAVVFDSPLPIEGSEFGPAGGYYQNIGLTAGSEEEAKKLVGSIVSGTIDWSDTSMSVLPPDEAVALMSDNGQVDQDWRALRIWYRSGRVYFPAESKAR